MKYAHKINILSESTIHRAKTTRMNLAVTLLIFCPVIAVVGYVTWRAWRARDAPGGTYLFCTYTGVLVWLSCYAVELNIATAQWKIAVAQVEYLGITTSPVFYALFTAEYTRGFRPSRRQLAGLLLIPALTVLFVWTNPLHQLVWTNYDIQFWHGLSLARRQFETWFYVHLAYSYVAFLVGLVFVVDVITDENFFFRRQSAAILLGSLVPICAALIYPLGLSPLPGFDFVLFGLAVNGALFGYAFFATEFYDIIPAIRAVGWARMADQIETGIVVTDMNTTIIEVNQRILEIFGLRHEELVGSPVTALFEDTTVTETVEGAYEFELTQGNVYRLQWRAVRDRRDRRIGYTYTVTDITERKRREQQLEVLNRTLRHNLRNKINVISAHAERIQETGADGDIPPVVREDAADIVRAADRIDEIGQTARHVEELIGNATTEAVDLSLAIELAIQSVRDQYPEGTISEAVPGGVTIEACPGIEHAFAQIVKNAFQHNDATETTVTITAEAGEETVRISFNDDGDGIPAHELESIETGEESALDHASGMGLWFIKWITEASGGELVVDTGTEGTTIHLDFVRTAGETQG